MFNAIRRNLLGVKSIEETDGVLDTKNGPKDIVIRWNDMRAIRQELEANWTPINNTRCVELREDMTTIEKTCSVMYTSLFNHNPERFNPQNALEKFKGQNIHKELNSYNNDALTAFKARIVPLIFQHSSSMETEFVDNYLEDLPEHYKEKPESLSFTFWKYVAEFWENGVADALGEPENIYVTANIRSLIIGLRHSDLLNKGFEDTRDMVEPHFPPVSALDNAATTFFDGGDPQLQEIFKITEFPDGQTGEILSEALEKIILDYFQTQKSVPREIIRCL